MTPQKHEPEKRQDRRFYWRDQSHVQSHSLEPKEIPPLDVHPLASHEPPVVVATAAALTEMVRHLRAEGRFAYDSEFIGERYYLPLLCLVQVATTQKVFLVDALAGLDLRPLWELVASPEIETIVLAGQQDLAPPAQQLGRPPANILDVQIAAGFIHTEYPLSLGRLLQEFLGISLGKGLTFTHWDKRPLTAVQVHYAANDVRYLVAARQVIAQKLAQAGRTDWARQECAAALEEMSLYHTGPESLYLKVHGRERLKPRQLAVLRELTILRDQAAKQEDIPARTLLKDALLVAIAKREVKDVADLDEIRGLPRPVEHAYGQQIVEATTRGLAVPDALCPPLERGEPRHLREASQQAMAEISKFCMSQGLAPALVTSRKDVALTMASRSRSKPHKLLAGWRKQLLGDLLDRVL